MCNNTQERQKYKYSTLFWSAKSRFAHFFYSNLISRSTPSVLNQIWHYIYTYIFTIHKIQLYEVLFLTSIAMQDIHFQQIYLVFKIIILRSSIPKIAYLYMWYCCYILSLSIRHHTQYRIISIVINSCSPSLLLFELSSPFVWPCVWMYFVPWI